MVKERGQKVPKPWKFKYTVGEPMGVISQPEMDVLYIGYPNRVSVSASGFPADAVSISCSGCSASKKGNEYIVSVSPGTRQAKISMSAKDESGKTTSLGEKTFRVYSPPLPEALFNGRPAGDVPKAYFIGSKATLSVAVKGTPLSGLKYGVNSYVVEIGGQKFPVSGGDLPQNVKNVIRGLNPGTTIVFRKIKYSGTASGITSAAFTLN